MTTPGIAMACLCGLLGGCDDDAPAPAAPTGVSVLVSAVAPPRRPTRRYYFARTSERCEVFAEDGQDRSEATQAPCPEYLEIGERIRIAGMTCTLENKAQPEREKPVVCPDPLSHFEKEERAQGR